MKYYFAYIAGVPPQLNDKIILGSAFHSAVEFFFTARLKGQTAAPAAVSDAFDQHFAACRQQPNITWRTPPEKTRRRGLAFVDYFLQQIAPAIQPLMCEQELCVEIPDSGIKLKGVIDLVEEDFSITDFKTSTSKWPPGKAQTSLQMIIYKYLFDQTYGGVNSTLKYEILYAKNASRIQRQTMPVNATAESTSQMLTIVRHVTENIRHGVFYRRENHGCRFCEYKKICFDKNPPETIPGD